MKWSFVFVLFLNIINNIEISPHIICLGFLLDINHTQGPGLCICSYGQHTDEAARLCIDFSERVNTINVANYGYINMTDKEIPIPEDLPGPVMQLRNLLENEKKSTAYPYALLEQENADAFRLFTKRFFAGEYSVETFLKEGCKILKPDNFTTTVMNQ